MKSLELGVGRVWTTGRASLDPVGRGIMERDSWRYPPWLSRFPRWFRVFRPAIGRGSRQRAKWDCFWGREFHRVPFNSIHFYLFAACEAWLACPVIWPWDVEPRISRMSGENPGFDRGDRSGDRFIISYYHFFSRGKRLMDRPKPFSNTHLRRAAGADSGTGQGHALRGGDFGSMRSGLRIKMVRLWCLEAM